MLVHLSLIGIGSVNTFSQVFACVLLLAYLLAYRDTKMHDSNMQMIHRSSPNLLLHGLAYIVGLLYHV